MMIKAATAFLLMIGSVACSTNQPTTPESDKTSWRLVENFESGLEHWTHIDVENNTDPFIPDPQIAEIRQDQVTGNRYLITKPAADGVVGNRKAIGFRSLPEPIGIGDVATIYTRINVESFPNNQSFGLANVPAAEIGKQHYNAFEPMLRVTDKYESNGDKNTGALQVLGDGPTRYSDIVNPATGRPAKPLSTDLWYELWYVVNNAPPEQGGQRYDVYLRGGEFKTQQLVYSKAVFRMQRTQPLQSFITICNTGPHDKPYGNGGVRYDDIYMASGINLSSPR